MTSRLVVALVVGALLCSCADLNAQDSEKQSAPQCQHKASHDASHDHEAMMGRGEKGMGFSQTKTAHHFFLKPDGGMIVVSANDSGDAATRDQIRMHLTHIAHSFAEGNFGIPMFVHDQVPPGVPVMKKHAGDITYKFKETDNGGKVIVSSSSPEAIQAIHDFLIFQIREHKTGDPLVVQ
jgi:hypothetical protein